MLLIACATSAALPTLVWTKMYACTTIRVVPPAFQDGGGCSLSGRIVRPWPQTAYARRCASRYIVRRRRAYPGAREISVNLSRSATLAEVGEFRLIAAITEGLSLASDVRVGPGDDAAVLSVEDAVAAS